MQRVGTQGCQGNGASFRPDQACPTAPSEVSWAGPVMMMELATARPSSDDTAGPEPSQESSSRAGTVSGQ